MKATIISICFKIISQCQVFKRSSLNKYQCLYLSNERINILDENFLAVQWLGLSLHYRGQGFHPWSGKSHNLWGAAKKKKKGKTTTTKKHSQGIMRCLLSQEKRCTVNVSKNSNETWCLSIPLPCKVLNAGIFVLIPSCHNYRPIAPSDTTPPLFNPRWSRWFSC